MTLNTDCGFTPGPKFAAAGIFTQIGPIVAQLQPDGWSESECVAAGESMGSCVSAN